MEKTEQTCTLTRLFGALALAANVPDSDLFAGVHGFDITQLQTDEMHIFFIGYSELPESMQRYPGFQLMFCYKVLNSVERFCRRCKAEKRQRRKVCLNKCTTPKSIVCGELRSAG